MKIMTVLGTRPEIIRLSRIIARLDEICDHLLVHTGQNHDRRLSQLFFDELGIRAPDHTLGAAGAFGEQVGRILIEVERLIHEGKPDRMLILGDTNSALAAVAAKRCSVPVYHMEAGNRCYDDRVPEEVNRRIVDHCSDILLPYTERSRQNLIREGIPPQWIYVTGNPIYEVINCFEQLIEGSNILPDMGLTAREYFLATLHRAENVDDEYRLARLLGSINVLQREYGIPVIVSTHPHLGARMESAGIGPGNDAVRFLPPFGFPDFVSLERAARCVLTDSGTVQEECCILGTPNVIMRDVTERPETIECGSAILSGCEPRAVLDAVRTALTRKSAWSPPPEYLVENVSDTVVNVVTGFAQPRHRGSTTGAASRGAHRERHCYGQNSVRGSVMPG